MRNKKYFRVLLTVTCVDGGFSGSYGHVGGVGHQRCSLHDALRLSIHLHRQLSPKQHCQLPLNNSLLRKGCQYTATYFREVSQYFWHLISTLPTAYVDDDITVGVFGQGLGDDSLSTAKGSWDSCGSSLHTSSNHEEKRLGKPFWKKIKGKRSEGEFETHGNRASSTLCPVSSGWLAGSFSVTGRTCLTGHTCTMVNFSFTPSNSSSITTSWHRNTQHQHKSTPHKLLVNYNRSCRHVRLTVIS